MTRAEVTLALWGDVRGLRVAVLVSAAAFALGWFIL